MESKRIVENVLRTIFATTTKNSASASFSKNMSDQDISVVGGIHAVIPFVS